MRIKVIPYNTTEYGSLSAFPGTGESGKYYLALDTMILYVWSSNAYTAASFRYEGKPTYHGSYLKSGYLEFTMAASPAPIDWHSGDYIRYNRTGRVYKMYNVPQTERQSGTNHNGDSFAYRNVQFYDSVKELELTPFRDYVQGQNQYFFSSKQDVQTTEPVSGIVARLNANLTDYFGSGVWNVTIAENIPSSFEVDVAKDYSVSGTCLDALNAIYETWNELGWGFSVVNGVNTITIGYPNVAPATSGNRTNVFSYGSGLTALKRNTGSLNDFCTRMHVFGTERNLINRYYNGKDIYNAASVYIPNLMIPLEHWGTTSSKPDASKAYIEDQSKIDLYGLITKDVYFDGTDGKPEVYPSIEEQTIEVLKAAKTTLGKTGAGAPDYYPQTNDDTIRVDAVKSIVTMPVDDGSLSSSGSRYIDTYDATISSPIVNGQSRTSRSAGETTLYEYTFDDSGIVDVKWEGALKFVLNQALGANDYLVLRLCIYKGSVTRSNRLSAIEFSKVSDVTNGQILSLDITKAIGTREEQFTGKIILTLEYYFVVSGGGTRTITITKEGDVTTSVGLREALASTFKVKTQQIGFDISKMTSSGGASLALKSGMCAGREFPITRAVYNSSDDSWTLTCKRTQDNSTEIYYPNAQFPIAADELFVILGITMPEEYILAQSERLYALGQELYNRVSVYKPSYEPSIDSKQVLANITAHPSDEQYKLIEGKYMRLYDTDIISGDHSAEVLITELTIGEGDAEIATYRVVLSDKATVSGGITRSIANISNEVQQMQSAQRSAMRGFDESEGGGTIPDGGTNVNPVFIKDGVPQAVDGIDVQDDIHTGSAISADGNLSVGGNADIDGNANIDGNATIGSDADVNGDITSEHGDIQALAGGVSANGIADLSQSGSGGAGTVTDVKVNNVSQPQSDGTVSITLADVALSGNYNDLNNKPTIADAIKFDANVSYQETTPFTPINGLISLPAYNTWAQLLPSGGIPNTDLANSSITLNSNSIALGNTISLATFLSYLGANQASGVLKLDGSAKIPIAQIPDAILGQLVYGGTFVPSTGVASLSTGAQYKLQTQSTSITLTNDTTATTGYVANEGIYYLASASGTFAGLSFQDGDWLVSTGNAWKKIDNTDAVTSVNSQIGAVTIGLTVVGDTIQVTTGSNNAITVPFATKAGSLVVSAAVGGTDQPVYIDANGAPQAISYTIGRNVAANEDVTAYTSGDSINITNHVVKVLMTGTSSPSSTSGTAISFVDSITQTTAGVVTYTTKTVRDASTSQSGVVSTSAQSFAGAKTFASLVTAQAGLTATGGNIQAQAGGISANGIADLAMVSGGGSGTLTAIKIGSVEVTNVTDGVVTIAAAGTFNASSNRLALESNITSAINGLSITSITNTAGKTISSISESNGIVSASFQDISITSSQISNFPSSGSGLLKWSGSAWSFEGHQTIYSLTIKNSSDVTLLTYTPNSAAASISLTKTMVGLSNVENTALSTWTGNTSIASVGTITSGTWKGSAIGDSYISSASTWNAKQDALTFDGTYNASTNKAATVSTVTNAINALDVSSITGFGAGKTLATLTETDGKIAATFQDISIPLSKVTDTDDLRAIEALTGTSGLLKKTAANTWALDTNTYLTGNQTITLSGDVSGSGTTSISVSIGAGKVTNAMLAGSIANGKLANSAITINGSSTSLGGSFNTASINGGTAGTSSATSGLSISIPYVTISNYGIVTAFGTHTHSISASDITTAIGSTTYAPYNSAGYLPLSGGTMTGAIKFENGADGSIRYSPVSTWSTWSRDVVRFVAGNDILKFGAYGATGGQLDYCFIGVEYNNQYCIRVNKASNPTVGASNVILHAGNYSSYALPITGGTLKNANYGGQLTIWRDDNNGDAVIVFKNNTVEFGRIGFTNTTSPRPYWTPNLGATTYVFYHTGNANSTSIGWSASSLTLNGSISGVSWYSGSDNITLTKAVATAGDLYVKIINSSNSKSLSLLAGTSEKIGLYSHSLNQWLYYINTDNTLHLNGNHYLDGNLTISGEFALGDVIYQPNNKPFYIKDTGGTYRAQVWYTANDMMFFGRGGAEAGHDTYLCGNNVYITYSTGKSTGIYLNSSGNVGIGNGSPGYKLTVSGTFYSGGAATFASTITASGNITSSAGVAAGGIADLSMN